MIPFTSLVSVFCPCLFRNGGTVFLAAALASPVVAGLRWEATTVERIAKVGEDTIQLAFTFSNPDPAPITIFDFKPSCGCTVAVLDKRTYGPGEKGALTVLFDTRDLSGVQEKTIEVFTDDAKKPTTLTLRITIPPWLEVSPRLLWWSVGEAAVAKEAIVSLSSGTKVKITSFKTDSPAMEVTLRPAEGNEE